MDVGVISMKSLLTVLGVAITKMAPQGLKALAKRIKVGTKTKDTVPEDAEGLLGWVTKWIIKNPGKTHLITGALYVGGDVVVRELIETNPTLMSNDVVKSVVGAYKSKGSRLREVQEIVGDGEIDTVHGESREDFVEKAELALDTRDLLTRAFRIVGGKQNFIILRDAMLTIEPAEVELHRK
uniref:Uncharacterized protein n=1 Tax=viral metagenome TaxID=1070528 RepID=A0A2V0RBU9_9ZZZZ